MTTAIRSGEPVFRGVGILVDDFLIASRGHDAAGISQHPNMEIRFFNPWGRRGSGFVTRGMEWLWRAILEPRRLGPRYLLDGLAFPGIVWREWRRTRER